jgi:tetratricopeptide (TPR) repeat protein
MDTWFNYYVIIALFLVPTVLQRRREVGALAVLTFAASYALPEFGSAATMRRPPLSAIKVLIPLVFPAYVLATEIRAVRGTVSDAEPSGPLSRWLARRGRAFMAGGIAVCLTLCILERVRLDTSLSCAAAAEDLRSRGLLAGSLAFYEWAARLRPGDAVAQCNLGATCASLGQVARAEARFKRALARPRQRGRLQESRAGSARTRRSLCGGRPLPTGAADQPRLRARAGGARRAIE